MLVLVPTIVVVMLGPEFSSWPLRLQVIVMGKSPWETTHVNCANDPESTTSDPKEKGIILGGSKTKMLHFLLKDVFQCPPVTTCDYH